MGVSGCEGLEGVKSSGCQESGVKRVLGSRGLGALFNGHGHLIIR